MQYFIRYTYNNKDLGLQAFNTELEKHIKAIIQKGGIITGIEFYKQ